MSSGIYVIKNTANDKVYIGSSNDIERRIRTHFQQLETNKHYNHYLQASYNKYGANNFISHTLEFVDDLTTLETIEQWWIDNCEPEYNLCPVAGSRLGTKHTTEAKRKISIGAQKPKPHQNKPVVQIDKDTNEIIKIWPSIQNAETTLGLSAGNINAACKGYYKTSGGYKWKYLEQEVS